MVRVTLVFANEKIAKSHVFTHVIFPALNSPPIPTLTKISVSPAGLFLLINFPFLLLEVALPHCPFLSNHSTCYTDRVIQGKVRTVSI